ncbi:MAG: NAD(P)H-dependent oxidoreductase [Planctomycetes bacterium]|nr:NAD(P)H-dependent oxidoreductase [Planctomycetota bacterium]
MNTRILILPGSLRAAAFSKQLARAASMLMSDGVEATVLDLQDYRMPLYDGDLEQAEGLPAGAVALREQVRAHDAVLFVSPEYNASIPAVLKNAIDWVSRPYAAEPDVKAWAGKVAGLLASSPGALGGLRGLVHLRQILMNVGMQVVTEQFALGSAHEAFADDGSLASERARGGVDKVVASVVRMARALA